MIETTFKCDNKNCNNTTKDIYSHKWIVVVGEITIPIGDKGKHITQRGVHFCSVGCLTEFINSHRNKDK